MARFGFVGGTYQLRDVDAEAQRCQNWYPQAVESGVGASAATLEPTWGLAHFCDLTGPSVRGCFYQNGRLFSVTDQFYEVFSNGTQVAHAFLPNDGNPVVMVANNANQLLICTAGQLWLFPLAAGSIVYQNVSATIVGIQIRDNGGANLDYYIGISGLFPAWTPGTTMTINGVTYLPFLNAQQTSLIDTAGNVHVQLPRTLSQGFTQAINQINVSVASTSNANAQLSPTTADQVALSPSVSWLNPAGIIGTSSAAQVLIPNTSAQVYCNVLRGQNFNFAVPSNGIIDGILVDFQVQTTATQFVNGNLGAQLQKAGAAVGNLPNIIIPTGPNFSTVSFGANNDTWGTSWTPADINNGGFGVGVHVSGQFQGTQGNLIANGDFEEGPNTQPAVNWTTFLAGATWGYSGQFYTGTRSYGVIPTPGAGPFPAIEYQQTLAVNAGDMFTLSGAILNTSLATQGSIFCQFFDANNNYIPGSQQGISNTTTVIANFVFLTAIVTAPPGATQMTIQLVNDNATASCYYDSVQLVAGHPVQLQGYQITVFWHANTYNASVSFSSPVSPFQLVGQSLTFQNLTNNPQLNGGAYPLATYLPGTNVIVINNVPATAPYNGPETGTVTGDITYYAGGTETGTISGNVISYNDNPVQVANTLGPFAWVGFLDGFFLGLLEPEEQTKQGITMQWSNLEDGTTWDPANYFRVLPFTDSVLGAICNQRNIWLWGPKNTIVYYNTGDLLNPFQPIPGAYLEYGLGAEWSPAKLDNSVFWVGADERGWAMAFRSNGWSEQRISNHALEQEWNDYPTVSDAISYSIQADGHQFYHVLFPTAGKSWRYDAATGLWHEPCFWNGSANVAHRSRVHVFAFSQHLLGDTQSGSLYLTTPKLYTDDVTGAPLNPIRRMRRAPHVTNELEWEFHQKLRVHFETGLGPMPPLTGQALGVLQQAAQDANGVWWQFNVTDAGVFESQAFPGTDLSYEAAPNFVDLGALEYERQLMTYAVSVTTAGQITTILVPPPGGLSGYVQHLPLTTFPSGLQTGLSVQLGRLVIDAPIAAPREPQVMLRFSDDGAHTWSNEYICGAGMHGEFKRRVEYRRLGRSRSRTYEISVTDPIPWRLVDAYLFTAPSNQQPVQRLATQLAKMA